MGLFDKLFGGKAAKPTKPEAIAVLAEGNTVYAAVNGRVEATEAIPDPVFAAEAMGRTVAIWPADGNVYAPVSGTLTTAMPHAFGMVSDDGVEVLVHVGIDTVNMKGDGFSVWVEAGAHVSAGQPLLTFDRDKVAKAGYQDIVMTIVTNSDDYASVDVLASGEVKAGDTVMRLV